jgi:hypothetical protein
MMRCDPELKSRSPAKKERLYPKHHNQKGFEDMIQLCLFPLDFSNINSQEELENVIKTKCC